MFTFERTIEDEFYESIFNDYELLCSIYQDDIKEIINNQDELKFILNINYELNLESLTINTINNMKINELNIENNSLLLPYWIQFNFEKNLKKLCYKFYIYWIKDNTQFIEKTKKELSTIEEPFIYNSIELIKENLENTLNNTNIISILYDIKLKNTKNYSLKNALFIITKANVDCNDFLYKEKIPKELNSIKIENNNSKNNNNETNHKNEYELFFKKGGIKSDILTEKDYAFQSHAIVIKNKEDINLYKSYLLSNNKIKKATRNVFAFRFFDKESKNIIEDYDDDGEHYAGTRILGLLQKMKIYNILVLVSRFNGDLHLRQHSTKYLNIAEILIKNNMDLFSFE